MGRPVERGYYWHDDDVVIVDIGVPTDPLNRTTDEHGNYLQILCWGELRAGKLLVYPVVDDGRWGERIERPKDSRTGADRAGPLHGHGPWRATFSRVRLGGDHNPVAGVGLDPGPGQRPEEAGDHAHRHAGRCARGKAGDVAVHAQGDV